MNSDIQIITIPVSRWEEYKKLRLEALEKEPQAFGAKFDEAKMKPDKEWIERIESAEVGENDIMLFAEKEGKLIGMIGAYFNKSKENMGIANIWGFYVSEKYRSQGVGKRLVEEIISKIKKINTLYKIKLYVNQEQKSAFSIYEQSGFTISGTEEYVLGDGKKYNEYVMETLIKQ